MSRLIDQLTEALAALAVCETPPALIGGLALAAHGVVRATQDVDLLIDTDDADVAHQRVQALGYECVHRSVEAANYERGDEGLDLLYAHRAAARHILAQAEIKQTPFGEIRVVGAEGLIAFKLQSYCNDPDRGRDLDDMKELLYANRDALNMQRVRDYFSLFDREDLLDELLVKL